MEPAEIEGVLARHESVARAVVIARDAASGAKRLVAYVVPAPGHTVAGGPLKEHVGAVLPEYMVPSAGVPIANVSLTPNGKLDQRALPVPGPDSDDEVTLPDGPAEVLLGTLFAEVLGRDLIGRHQSFFDLGGDSLSAMRLKARLLAATGTDLAVRLIFEHPTVAALAARLGTGADPGLDERIVTLREGDGAPGVFCVPAVEGTSWNYRGLLDHLDPAVRVYGLQAWPLLAGAAPASLTDLAAAHVDAILGAQPDGPWHLIGWSFGGCVAHEVAVQLQRRGKQVASPVLLDVHPLFGDALAASGLTVDGHDVPAEAMEVLLAAERLRVGHVPGVFDGPVELFVAAADRLTLPDWDPYVRGPVRRHEVHAGHAEMLDPLVLRLYGAALTEMFR
ncbi:thioesterase domain-containing protein [Micromonospora sp. NPDC048843]|uniref:thioesterase domain-containing protein n=1 Tax=Micromonospora sp. NPDC048843 TaxID=3155389 RepID=UPI0033C9549B